MTSNNASNFGFGTAGQLVKSNGAGSAVSFTTATYPSTAGTSGNVLTSDGTNWTSAAAAGGLSSLKNTPEWFDDFVSGATASGDIGDLGWTSAIANSAVVSSTAYEAGHPGILLLATQSNSAGRVSIFLNSSANAFAFGNGTFTYSTVVRVPTLSDGTNTYKVFVGLYDNPSMNNSGEGIYFTYTHSENSGNWTIVTSDESGSSTPTDSTVAATTNFVNLSFVCNAAATSVEFFIDGVSVGTITTTIPQPTDITIPFYGIIKSAGGTSRSLDIDAFYSKYALTSSRFS